MYILCVYVYVNDLLQIDFITSGTIYLYIFFYISNYKIIDWLMFTSKQAGRLYLEEIW